MTVNLVEFLRARLDEDARIARAATWCDEAASWHAEPSPFGARDAGQRWYVEDAMDDGVVSHVDPTASDDEGVARHIAEHDPVRVLREIDAKRKLLAAYESAVTAYGAAEVSTTVHHIMTGSVNSLRYALQLLALSYADHPGYKEEWRP